MRLIVILVALVLASGAHAQRADADAARGAVASLEKLLQERPADAALWFYLARFRGEAGDRRGGVEALQKVLDLGEGFLPPRDHFASLWEDESFQAVRGRLEAKLPRLDFAPTAFSIQDRTLLPEGIAHDAPSRTFFIGSVSGRIVRVTASGTLAEFVRAGSDPLLGLAVDAPRRLLYAVSTSALTSEGRKQRRNAVFSFDIDTRRLVARYDVPAAQQLNDVAVAPGGRVFATDTAAGALYEIAVKGPGPSRQVVPAGRLGGANGLAASADGKRIYVAHSTGLAVVDMASGEMKRVTNETRENVAAIDGLYQWQGQLIGVQNLTNPGRVIAISLGRDGERITRVQTLLSHHHNALDLPTTGAVAADGFYLLAATGIDRLGAEGRIEDPDSVPNPAVVRIPLPR